MLSTKTGHAQHCIYPRAERLPASNVVHRNLSDLVFLLPANGTKQLLTEALGGISLLPHALSKVTQSHKHARI